MFYQRQYKKLHLVSYICLVGSLFLAPLLRAESKAITQNEGKEWLVLAAKGEEKNMEKLIEKNPNYLTWVNPLDQATALTVASCDLQTKVVRMILSKLSKKQGDHLNVKMKVYKEAPPLNAIAIALDQYSRNRDNYNETCSIIEAIIKKAKQYKIKLDFAADGIISEAKNPFKNMNILMLISSEPLLFKLQELLIDSAKEIGLDLNERLVINDKFGGSKEEKKDIAGLENGTLLTILVYHYQKGANKSTENKNDSLDKELKKRKEIIKKLLHAGVPLDEVSKSLAKQDKDLLQFMENEVKSYKFWRNLKIGGGIIGLLALVASMIGGAYWFFLEKSKRESQKG